MKILRWALPFLLLAAWGRADTAVTLYSDTGKYLQILPSTGMPSSYFLVMPKSTGTLNQALTLTRVSGNVATLGFVTGGGGGGSSWGSITGTLSDQTDLNTVLVQIGASTGTLSVSTASLQSQITGLGSTYLTNSSATATYLQIAGAATTYLTQSSATATYLQDSSATVTYLNQSVAASSYLSQSSATATYLQLSSANVTYAQKSIFASATSTGLLTATDWNTFNNKGSGSSGLTYSSFSATTPILYNNTTGALALDKISLSTMVVGSLPAASIAAGSLGAQVIGSSITQGAMYGSPTLNGANITNIQGAQVGSGVPATSIAAGLLGPSVVASSIGVNAVYPAAVSAGSYPNITGVGTLLTIRTTTNTITGGTTEYADGLIRGTNLTGSASGINTGDQTITLTGDVTGSGTGSFATTAAALQNSIKTFSSSVTVTGPGGMGVTYNVNAGSMTGAGLSSCSGVASALTWNSSTNLFGCNTISAGGSGASTLAVTTGTATGWTTVASSPTNVINADNNYFTVSLAGGATAFWSIVKTTFTLLGPNPPAASIASGSLGSSVVASSITQAAMYGSPTLNAANITNIQGTQVGSGVPAANIASGLLGGQVVASSVAVNSVYPAAVSAGSYPNITGVGTITAGVWSGTRLTSGAIPTDTMFNDNAPSLTVTSSMTASATIATSSNVVITSTGSVNALKVTANGTYGTTNGSSGGLLLNCTGGGAAGGMCAQIYSNAGTQNALAGLLNIVNDSTTYNEPMLFFQDASSTNGHPQIRIDALAPNLEIVNTSLGGTAKFEPFAMPAAGDYLQVNGRDFGNTSFKDIARWHRFGGTAGTNGALGFNALQMMTTGQVLWDDATDTHKVGFRGANSIPADTLWILPTGDNLGAMQSDGAGNLNFSKVSFSTGVTGTIQAGNFPALTGDVTTSAGSLATTAAALQPNINTFSSSVTVTNASGLKVTYGVSVGSVTGAGLSTCGDSTHALAWNSATNLFSCQSLTGGGGGSTNGTITAGAQNSAVVYTLAGSTTTVGPYTPVQFAASGVSVSTPIVMSSSGSIGPFTTLSLTGGGIFDTTAGTVNMGPLSANGLTGNIGDILISGGPGGAVSWSSAPTVSTLVVTGAAVIPTASQNFGAATMNQWFTSVAANQNAPAAGALNNLVWMGIGDSHMSDNNITRQFVGNMQANFGNAGEWFPLSNAGEQTMPSRPNSCSSYTIVGAWSNINQQSNAHGLEDDEVQSTSVGASISATCGGADTVILHYVKFPNAGSLRLSVDGANTLTFPTANASVVVASMVVTGLAYGVHTASVSYVTSGSAGVAATDFVFYSTATPGFVNYRIGAYGSQASNIAAQDQTQYVNLLNMMPAPPSIVLMSFGTNEGAANTPPATMVTNIHTVMNRIRTAWPRINCAYMTEPDAQNSSLHTYSSAQYAQALLQASVNDGCAFIDFTAFFSSEPYFSKYYSDGVHLTASGGLVAGNMLTNIFSNQSGDITPFTFNASSGVLSWGTNISSASLNNAASFGYSNIISSSAVGAGAFGNYLTNSSSSTLYLGYAHITSSGTKPTAGACGTTPVIAANSTDRAGAITWSGNAATCVVNYGTTWGQSPFCVANSTATPVGVTSTRTAQTLTFVTPGLFASTATWHCEGGQGQ